MIQRRARSSATATLSPSTVCRSPSGPARSPGAGLLREPARLLRWPFGLPLGSADSFHPGSHFGVVPDPARPSVLANQPPVHPPQGGAPMRSGP
jgi:hypothetical protein